jgi:hypothetical protein
MVIGHLIGVGITGMFGWSLKEKLSNVWLTGALILVPGDVTAGS